MNIHDIDQEKLQGMVLEATATSAQYNAMSDRMFQLRNLIPVAEKNLKVAEENQRAAHPAFPDVPVSIRSLASANGDKSIKPIPAQDFSKRVNIAKERLDQLLKEKATLPARMAIVGNKNIRLATTLREINRSLIAADIRVICLENYS